MCAGEVGGVEEGAGKGQMSFHLLGHCTSLSGAFLEIIYWLKSPYVTGSGYLMGHM